MKIGLNKIGSGPVNFQKECVSFNGSDLELKMIYDCLSHGNKEVWYIHDSMRVKENDFDIIFVLNGPQFQYTIDEIAQMRKMCKKLVYLCTDMRIFYENYNDCEFDEVLTQSKIQIKK